MFENWITRGLNNHLSPNTTEDRKVVLEILEGMTTGHGVCVIIIYYFYTLLLHNMLAISIGCYLQFLPLSVADSYIEFLEFLVPWTFQSPGPSADQVKF